MGALSGVKAMLDAIEPRLWPVLIALLSWGFVALWTRVHPASFKKIPKSVQALPSTAVALALAGVAAADLKHMLIDGLFAAVMAQAGIGAHHSLKRLPFLRYGKPAVAMGVAGSQDRT